jgi:hypothetical protein
MAPRGRPPLTEEILRERTAAYCVQYGVKESSDAGLPPYPAGKRESRQHRDWVNLAKAWSRLQRRTRRQDPQIAAALASQASRCPICSQELSAETSVRTPAPLGGPDIALHERCRDLVRLASELGLSALDRVRQHLSPAPIEPPDRARRPKRP